MRPKTPSSVEFALMTDPTIPGAYLKDTEISALFGVPVTQVREWHREYRETGKLSQGRPLARSRAQMINDIINKTLQVIVDVAEMDTATMTVKERFKHAEVCASVLPKIMPHAEEEEEEAPMTPEEALQKVLHATRGADTSPPPLH